MVKVVALATAFVLVGGSEASAQSAAPPATGAPDQAATVSGVTVIAERPRTAVKIDRKVYAAGADLQATSGSVSDVLKNVPSVEVDTDGNVSLRGDPNVQILIDGKPSTQLSSGNRAAALEEMPADQIESIEVIDNPSAAYKADGSAGIINIVTRKTRKPGASGSMAASVGDEGRKTIGLNGSYRKGRLSLYGGLNVRHDVRKRIFSDQRAAIDATSGAVSPSRQAGVNETRRLSPTLSGGADFDWTKRDRLSASFSYNNRTGAPRTSERDSADDATGDVLTAYDRTSRGKEHEVNSDYLAKWRHSFAGEGHELEIALHQSESDEHQRRTYTDVFSAPEGPDTLERMRLHGDELTRELSLDYTRPLGGGAELKAGYDLERNDDDYDNHDWTGEAAGAALTSNPALTDHFRYGQSIHALYATWQKPFGKLTVLAGLRLEQVYIDTHEITTAQIDHLSYFRAHPSLHLEYALSEAQTLRASYSHRVVRPDPEDLNPYPVYQDAFDYRAGNPRLMPQETHSMEAGWQWKRRGTSVEATAYWRQTYDSITDVSRDISVVDVNGVAQTVLLTTKENLGHSNAGGVETAASGKLTRQLSVNVSSNIFYSEIDAANLGFGQSRSTISYGVKASVDWKPTAADTFQLSSSAWGKRLTAQGYRLPSGTVNLGWRRRLGPELTLTATVADLFDTQRDRNVIDLPTLHDVYTRRQLGRVFYLGVTRRFGASKKAEDKFDYSS